jgi:DNA-binding response OmpR family regulator
MDMDQDSERILVVDDEQAILDLLERVLGREGYRVTTTNRDEEVVGLLSKERFDLAIMDVGLRNLNGGKLMKAVREASPWTAIVIMTGYPMEDVIRFAQEHAQGYLEKPFDLHELLAVARNAMRLARMPLSEARSAKVV